ncbi:MAG: hypothetical protein FWG61_04170 [Firmicutes bacterium]|nr:hypothetical protein [Bacillota bacterium]
MKKCLQAKASMAISKIWNRFSILAKEENGDFGIGQLAGIVAAVVIIGVVVSTITGLLPEWINDIWQWISDLFTQIGG